MTMPHIKYRTYQISAGLLVADIILFGAVNPRQASAPLLIIGYLLLCLTVWCLINTVASLLGLYQTGSSQVKRRLSRYLAVLISLLVGLQSVGQLTDKDTFALVPLMVLAYVYFGYGKSFHAQRA